MGVCVYKMNGYLVSTIFLKFNHGTDLEPMLFETAVFKDGCEQYRNGLGMVRASTLKEALENHKSRIEMARNVMEFSEWQQTVRHKKRT